MSDNEDPDTPAPGKDQHSKQHEPFVPPGAESTRELREMARRRREAEEKLQQHLQEAAEHHHPQEATEHHHPQEATEKPAED